MRPPSRKRGKAQSPISYRPKKKHKRLDAIHDKPISSPPSPPSDDGGGGGDQYQLRRSSRARRPPEVLDSSPVPSNRHPKNKNPKPLVPFSPINSKKRKIKEKEKGKSVSIFRSLSFEEEEGAEGWRSRLRTRGDGGGKNDWYPIGVSRKGKVGKRKKKPYSGGVNIEREEEDGDDEKVTSFDLNELETNAEDAEAGGGGGGEVGDKVVSFNEKMLENSVEAGETRGGGEAAAEDADKAASFNEKQLENSVKNVETREDDDEELEASRHTETDEEVEANQEVEEVGTRTNENTYGNDVVTEKFVKEGDMASPVLVNELSGSLRVKEGRRCVLCGRGMDGKPPKKLAKESVDSDNEAYEGSSASEEPNYDIWDGFGDEPGWLGRLLGPIHDRFGIARVWVHQHCAVWSPEVYFAGLGCLKNVRAALCRGRALKCSRCGRPGATIGCRVDRCPKTYHLPCSRADGCIFDHRKFLIACNDHCHLFQPQGISYSEQIRKRKAKKLKLEIRKFSNEACRKDLDAEEKWLEHCGEDEEFLKREGKRLHRDILRIGPTYIGGSSENEKIYQGWESVAGLQGVIQCMKEVVILPLLYPNFFSNMSLTPPRGVLLHGYPGTGKTLVVRALIGACSRGDKRIAYFARKGADCLGKYVGDAERQLRLLFQVAEKSQPSIIFFDEIDGLAPVRSRNQDQTHSSVVSTLLSLMDGLKSRGSVVVIGATNRPEAIDPALRRPGRFDREIYFPLPSEKDRSAILSLHTQSWPNPLSGPLLSWIANQTAGYAGADLQALCTQAAMSALKRKFALKELLSSAEKGSVHGRLPSLPSLTVEERDWLTALGLAPPPCSRREAGMAANDVVSSPLPTHLIPCLLQPLLRLLISFCNDERIWLPPALSKAAKSVWRIVVSSLQQRKLPTGSWWSHLPCLVEEKCIQKEIEENLSRYGLISVPSVSGDFCASDDNDGQKIDSFTLIHSSMNTLESIKIFPPKWGSLSGFRALISGGPSSGQQHLASCLLHSYMGHVDICKVNLATISQEGHGDLLRGLTQILSRCLNLGRCVIYMSRIDLWAIDENRGQDSEENNATTITCKSSTVSHTAISVTEIWNSFVEQVNSVSTSGSLIILATCEIKNHYLPLGLKQFFTSDVSLVDSAASEHTIPRFSVHIDGKFDHKLVLDSFAAKLSDDLVQNFIQMLHQRTHPCGSRDKIKVCSAVGDSEGQRKSMSNGQKTGFADTAAYSVGAGASCGNYESKLDLNSGPSSQLSEHQEAGTNSASHQDSFPSILASRTTVANSTLAIVTFGYQILRYPQFAELCWVTSKLREGPCTGINGPWKGWPFNACVMHHNSSPDKVSAGGNSNVNKEKDNSGVVRGLTAVGLLSYRGVYASVNEVAMEVRKVLEILVGHIRAKARKDRYQYLRILSQAAHLEDTVNCWAYKFDSSHPNNPSTESNAKLGSERRPSTENNPTSSNFSGNQSCNPNVVIKSCTRAQEILLMGKHVKPIISSRHCIDLNQELSNNPLVNSGTSIIPGTEHLQDDVPSVPLLPTSHSTPVSITQLGGEDESCRKEDPKLGKSLDSLKQPSNLETKASSTAFADLNISVNATESSSKDASFIGDDSETVPSSKVVGLVSNAPCKVADRTLREEDGTASTSCLYNCCSGCWHTLYVLVCDIVSQSWESNGRCSTIDGINNVISSCSLNLLAAFRKYDTSDCGDNTTEYHHRTKSEPCACREVRDKQFKQISCQNKASKNMLSAVECSCHLRNDEENATAYTECNSPFRQALSYFFRDGVLVSSSEPQKDDVLHCRYDKLCLCSVVEMILATRRPL